MTKHFEKAKKDFRRQDDQYFGEFTKDKNKKKLQPIEKTKYRQKNYNGFQEDEW